jgi:hypothetical protein
MLVEKLNLLRARPQVMHVARRMVFSLLLLPRPMANADDNSSLRCLLALLTLLAVLRPIRMMIILLRLVSDEQVLAQLHAPNTLALVCMSSQTLLGFVGK